MMKIGYSIYILFVFSLFTRQIDYFLIFFGSIICHELGHAFFIKIFNQKFISLELNFFGGRIDCVLSSSKFKTFIIYSGGIIVNIIICLLSNNFGKYSKFIYDYNMLMVIFNLLPIYPLDGFRMFSLFFESKTKLIISIFFSIGLFIVGIYIKSLLIIIIDAYLIILNYRYFKNYDLNYMMKLINAMS